MEIELEIKEPVAILGYGVEGKTALVFLQSHGVKDITICDENSNLNVPEGVELKLGRKAFDDLDQYQTIIRSPGVKYNLPGIEAVKSRVTSMTQWTMQVAGNRITAITGSNGKTTTTQLVKKILEAHYGNRLITGGNDSHPVLQEAIHNPKDPILLETSSFQYADMYSSPYIAAVLNITPNHLNWHDNFSDYIAAKSHLLCFQNKEDWAILNANDENTVKLGTVTKAQHFWIGQKRGNNWAIWEKDHLIISFDNKKEILLHKEDIRVKTHPDNLLFATAIAKLHRVPISTTVEQIKQFNGVEHRMEYVRTINDIHFYNDSACTVPESTEIAIGEFPHDKLILILGGSSKEADFSSLAKHIVDNDIRVYLIGEEGEKIQAAISALGGDYLILEYNKGSDYKGIIQDVYKYAKIEDNIVLSPACASFDMFENAKKRGLLFKEIVNEL